MADPGRTLTLLGRQAERRRLDGLLTAVRASESQVLVVRGGPGVGKTALLNHLAEGATGCRVARASGVEAEMELPYSGLHQLCAPFLDGVARLPGPQRAALEALFATRAGDPPDRFTVGLSVLSLLAETAEAQPLICLVDDVQWLDEASTHALLFVARRLDADPIALVFGVREGVEPSAGPLTGLPELQLRGLADADARALLESVVSGPLDPQVRDRIVAETRGNPLALVELPRTLTASELAYGVDLSGSDALTARIEQSFLTQAAGLSDPARQLLLLAAAEPAGDINLLWRAADRLGVNPAAAAELRNSGLLDLAAQVRFRHPLVRSAVYRGASAEARTQVHLALAGVTDPGTDPDRRAWHRAHATVGLDEAVAAELESSAGRARARGGMAASGAFLTRAMELTPDRGLRARRGLAAADATLAAGDTDGAKVLVAIAEAGPLGELDRARAQLLRARIAFTATRGREAAALLLAAARQLETLDATLAKETYLDAFAAAMFAGRLAVHGSAREVAAAVLAAQWGPTTRPVPPACDLLLTGVAHLLIDGFGPAAPTLRAALAGLRHGELPDDGSLRWLWLACRIARALGEDVLWDELTERQVDLARKVGALAVLPIALTERCVVDLAFGRLSDAFVVAAEAEAVVAVTGTELSPHVAFLLAAWRGEEDTANALLLAHGDDASARGEGLWLIETDWMNAVFLNGAGRYSEALVAAERAAEFPDDLGLSIWVLQELIEAAARSGQPERAASAMDRIGEVAAASDTDWLRGVEARCRALLAEDAEAGPLYREAVERLSRTRVQLPLARAQLLYGEWLRRGRQRAEARDQLLDAHRTFVELGIGGFEERARRELAATGSAPKATGAASLRDLTAQEAQIARLAAAGSTNTEIGSQLFLSPRTVEWHLRKVFGKLGIAARKELVTALA